MAETIRNVCLNVVAIVVWNIRKTGNLCAGWFQFIDQLDKWINEFADGSELINWDSWKRRN